MIRVAVFVALTSMLAADAYACPPASDKGAQLEKEGCVAAKPVRSKARSEHGGISAADKENLERAMSRNVLQSIDDQLRRQNIGN